MWTICIIIHETFIKCFENLQNIHENPLKKDQVVDILCILGSSNAHIYIVMCQNWPSKFPI